MPTISFNGPSVGSDNGTFRLNSGGELVTYDASQWGIPIVTEFVLKEGEHFNFTKSVDAVEMELNLLTAPPTGGGSILRVEYSTDGGTTWATATTGFTAGSTRLSQDSSGSALTLGVEMVRLRCYTDQPTPEGPETDDIPAVVGQPTTMIFGQSNAGFLLGGDDLEDEIIARGGTAFEIGNGPGSTLATSPDGAWNILTGDGTDTPGTGYTDLETIITNHLTTNPNAFIAAAVWWHGETDSTQNSTRDVYEAAVTAVFNGYRTQVGYDFPIVVVGLSDTLQNLPDNAVAVINGYTDDLAANLSEVYRIDLDVIFANSGMTEAAAMNDGLHYTTEFRDFVATAIMDIPAISNRYGLS